MSTYQPINPNFYMGGSAHTDEPLPQNTLNASLFNEYERIMIKTVEKMESGNDPGHFHTEQAKGYWGQATFNSTTGVLINHNKNMPFYTVDIIPISSPFNAIGDIWVEFLNTNQFMVYCSGPNNTASFRWNLKQLDVITSDISGSTIFGSIPGKVIEHNYPFKNHILNIIPSQNPVGYLGEFWVNRSSILDIVYNTGVSNSNFDYRLEIIDDVQQWAVRNFNSLSGINISHGLGTSDYDVFVIPEETTNGYLGEVWVEKNSADFTIYNSGNFNGKFIYYIAGLNSPTYFMRGRHRFSSISGTVIQHSLPHTNYDVLLMPVQNPNGYLGEYWIVKSNYFFTVYNSGPATTYFDYRICLI